MLSVEKHTLGILRVTDSKVMVTENFSGEGTPVDSSLLRLIYRAIQKKIPQHENSDILHSGRKISYDFFCLFSMYFFTSLPNFTPFTLHLSKLLSIKVIVQFSLIGSLMYLTLHKFPTLRNKCRNVAWVQLANEKWCAPKISFNKSYVRNVRLRLWCTPLSRLQKLRTDLRIVSSGRSFQTFLDTLHSVVLISAYWIYWFITVLFCM